MRPCVGFATVQLLEAVGCRVTVPQKQTCCGQPGYNSGETAQAKAVAKAMIAVFEPYDYVVIPSGSCAGMMKHHYPALLAGDSAWQKRAQALADKCHELTNFLYQVRKYEHIPAVSGVADTKVTYHDSCASLREMKVEEAPRELLKTVADVKVKEMPAKGNCCGFGGTFAVKNVDVSLKLADLKLKDAGQVGAELVIAGDMGCLMHLSARAIHEGKDIEFRHVAEVLAGLMDDPAIGSTQLQKKGMDDAS